MTSEEFYKTAIITEDSIRKTVDVRPFGDRDGEAFDFYVADLFMKIKNPTFTIGKPIVVLRNPRLFTPPATAMDSYKGLLAAGVPIGIEEGAVRPDPGVLSEGVPSVQQPTKSRVSPRDVGHWHPPEHE